MEPAWETELEGYWEGVNRSRGRGDRNSNRKSVVPSYNTSSSGGWSSLLRGSQRVPHLSLMTTHSPALRLPVEPPPCFDDSIGRIAGGPPAGMVGRWLSVRWGITMSAAMLSLDIPIYGYAAVRISKEASKDSESVQPETDTEKCGLS